MSSIFESERTRLSIINNDNLPQQAEWMSDFGLQRLVNPFISTPMSADDLLDPNGWFQSSLNDEKSRTFGIHTRADNQFIGICAVVNLNMFAHHAEIGINIANPDFQSKGYGREVMILLMRYSFEQFNLNRLMLKVMGFNTRALRLYEKLGFQYEVTQRELFFHDGQYFDGYIMSILRSEWEAIYG